MGKGMGKWRGAAVRVMEKERGKGEREGGGY